MSEAMVTFAKVAACAVEEGDTKSLFWGEGRIAHLDARDFDKEPAVVVLGIV